MKISFEEYVDLADFVIDYSSKLDIDYCEARVQLTRHRNYILKNGRVETVGYYTGIGVGSRVKIEDTTGFFSVNKPDKELLKNRLEEAVKIVNKLKNKAEKNPFSEEEPRKCKYLVKPKKPVENVSIEEKVELLRSIDKATQNTEARIPNRIIQLFEDTQRKYYVNSEGSEIESLIPRIYIELYLTGIWEGRVKQISYSKGESRGWEAIKDWEPVKEAEDRSKTLDKILKEAAPPPKNTKVDMVIDGYVTGLIVHESSGHPYEADRIMGREAAQAGESFITKKMLGKRIGSEIVTVVDDPTLKNSYGYYLYDDEGVKARRRYLMKNGLINEFLHNRETATKMGVKSNGAARAENYNREPLVRMANTFMLPGDREIEELIEEIKFGIYMKRYLEWNIDDKRFNMRFVGSEAYLIRKGEIEGLIDRPVLEITTPGFYGSIDALGKKLIFEAGLCGKGDPGQGVPVWFGGPAVRIRDIKLG